MKVCMPFAFLSRRPIEVARPVEHFIRRGRIMRCMTWCAWLLAAIAVQVVTVASPCMAGFISGIGNTNVDSYFGSQNDSYQELNGTPSAWTAIGTGGAPWFPGVYSLPGGIPTYPAPFVTPSNVNPFTAPAFASYANAGDSANSVIQTTIGTSQTTDDAQIQLNMSLTSGGAQYTYEQLNYNSDYNITNTVNSAGFLSGLSAGVSAPQFFVSGNVSTAGSYATFGGIINYWDIPPSPGAPILLGSYTYSYNNNTVGPFSSWVSGVGSISNGVNAPDTLRLTGDFFIIADPASMTVTSVPEPSSPALFGMGVIGLLGLVWRRLARGGRKNG
jgi:hypothetical protein